jgi:hypothetical protein
MPFSSARPRGCPRFYIFVLQPTHGYAQDKYILEGNGRIGAAAAIM